MSAISIASVTISTLSALAALGSGKLFRLLQGDQKNIETDKVSLEIREPNGKVTLFSGELLPEQARLLSAIVKNFNKTDKSPKDS